MPWKSSRCALFREELAWTLHVVGVRAMLRKAVCTAYALRNIRFRAGSWSRYASSRRRWKNVTVHETGDAQSFRSLLANSRLLAFGDPVGKTFEAEVIAVVDDQLYVDFGSKFHAVIPKPASRGEQFKRGTKLEVLVKDLEVTQHFLGDSTTTSLLEAHVEFVTRPTEDAKS